MTSESITDACSLTVNCLWTKQVAPAVIKVGKSSDINKQIELRSSREYEQGDHRADDGD